MADDDRQRNQAQSFDGGEVKGVKFVKADVEFCYVYAPFPTVGYE
jgi:hypothetical protein